MSTRDRTVVAAALVSIDITGGTEGTLSASGVLSPTNVQDVLTRNTYVLIRSTFAPSGEIRGQVTFAQQSEPYNGTGINPPGSLTGGGAILNGDIDLVLDNPLNSMAPGTIVSVPAAASRPSSYPAEDAVLVMVAAIGFASTAVRVFASSSSTQENIKQKNAATPTPALIVGRKIVTKKRGKE